MKKIITISLVILLASMFVSCSKNGEKEDSKSSEVSDDNNTQVQTENSKMPTCYVVKGTPVTNTMITIHTKCENGNIPIDEAKVTLDNTVKYVDYKGTYFSDYIGFRNLQPSTNYKAVLEVVVGGKTIKKSVKIKTREEVIDTPPSNRPPVWTKDFYNTGILITDNEKNNFIMNLKSQVLIEPMQELNFLIKKISLEAYEDNPNITYNGLVKIENGILKFSGYGMGTGSKESVVVTIRAISNKKSSDTKVKFDFLLPIL